MSMIWLIRHGESEQNAGLQSSDPARAPLTDAGEAQAHRVAGVFSRRPSFVVVSPFVRARQSADPTLARFSGVDRFEWPVQEFTYLAPARCENTTVIDRLPLVRDYWNRCDPAYVDGEGAESLAGLMRRVWNMLDQFKAHPDAFVAVFTHGVFIRAVWLAVLAGVREPDQTAMRHFDSLRTSVKVPNGAIVKCRLSHEGEAWVTPPLTDHLSGTPAKRAE